MKNRGTYKVKTIRGKEGIIDDKVNKFIEDKDVVDIKQSVGDMNGYNFIYLTVIYIEQEEGKKKSRVEQVEEARKELENRRGQVKKEIKEHEKKEEASKKDEK